MRGIGKVDGMQSIQKKDGLEEQSVPLLIGIGLRGSGTVGNRSRRVSTAVAVTMIVAVGHCSRGVSTAVAVAAAMTLPLSSSRICF